MYLKRYTIAAFLLMLLTGLYVNFYISSESVGMDFFGIPLPALSIAIWVVVPLFVLYIASVFHMSLYSILGGFKLRRYEKDYQMMIETIADAYLGKKETKHYFKTPRYQFLGSLIEHTTMFPTHEVTLQSDNEKINSVVKLIEDVKSGEIVDLKKYALESTNPLVIQNDRNRYVKGEINSEDILSNPEKYNAELLKEAYGNFVETSPLYAIEKYKEFLSKESLFKVLARINADENRLEVSNEALIVLFETIELSDKEYIEASVVLSPHMIPEQRMKLFEAMSVKNDGIMSAYLYTLYDLEMLEAADIILEISQPEEYTNFKAYQALKKHDEHYSINLFI